MFWRLSHFFPTIYGLLLKHIGVVNPPEPIPAKLRPPALVRARRKGNAIEISTEEVRELRVYLDDAMVELDKPVAIMVNGRKLHDATVKRSMDVLIDDAHRRRDPSMLYSAFVDLKVPALK